MIVTGISRSGTSLLLCLLYCTVINKRVDIRGERSAGWKNVREITKNPEALTTIQRMQKPCIMIRDPRALVTSLWNNDQYYISADAIKNGRQPGVLKNFECVKMYSEQHIYRYEHLTKRPDQFQDQLGQQWGLDYNAEFSDWPDFSQQKMKEINRQWGKKLNGIRPIDLGHNWRAHLQRIRQQFDAFPRLHALVCEYGYEQNSDWYDEVLDQTYSEAPPVKGPVVHVARPKPANIKMTIQQND